MRRVLAWIAVALAAGAFILLSLVFILKIKIIIPIILFGAALIMLYFVKRMPESNSDGNGNDDPSGGRVSNEHAFFDDKSDNTGK